MGVKNFVGELQINGAPIVTNILNGSGISSIAQVNAIAAGENSSAFGTSVAEKNDDGSYDLALSLTKGYNNTEWYNTDGTGSGATEDVVPIEPLTEPEYYKDGTTEITSVHDITFTTTGAHGLNAYAEGNNTLALGNYTHTEGYKTYAAASGSHAEGSMNVVFGVDSHSEGARNISIAQASHTEGMRNTALGKGSHIEGFKNQSGVKATWAHIEGEGNLIKGMASHGEGAGNIIYDDIEIIETTNPDGSVTTTEKNNIIYSHVEGYNNKVDASKAHAEGEANLVTADAAHVEGRNNKAAGKYSHAEGFKTAAIGQSAHSEGASSNIVPETVINADTAIEAFGNSKFIAALGLGSHAEGYNTLSLGSGTHSEGKETIAKGEAAHAEGYKTEANAKQSHTEGIGTIANGNYVHVQGQYNIPASSGFADIVGNGTADARSNAYTLTWTGNGHYAGDVYVRANWDSETGKTTGGEKLTTESELAMAVSDGLNSLTVENGSGDNSIQTPSTTASGKHSVAVGTGSTAKTLGTFVTGYYTQSQGSNYQSVRGRANLITASGSSGLFAEVVGGGSGNDLGNTRANAYTLDWSGNAHFAGDVYADATWAENSSGTHIVATTNVKKKLATQEYVDEKIANIDRVSEVTQLRTDLTDLESRVDSLSSDISSTEGSIDTILEDIESIKNRLSNIQEETLKNSLLSIQSQYDRVQVPSSYTSGQTEYAYKCSDDHVWEDLGSNNIYYHWIKNISSGQDGIYEAEINFVNDSPLYAYVYFIIGIDGYVFEKNDRGEDVEFYVTEDTYHKIVLPPYSDENIYSYSYKETDGFYVTDGGAGTLGIEYIRFKTL